MKGLKKRRHIQVNVVSFFDRYGRHHWESMPGEMRDIGY